MNSKELRQKASSSSACSPVTDFCTMLRPQPVMNRMPLSWGQLRPQVIDQRQRQFWRRICCILLTRKPGVSVMPLS